jgi:hypothetical protein
MEHEYRLDLDRNDFFYAIRNLAVGNPDDSQVSLTYDNGSLQISRHFKDRSVSFFDELSSYVQAKGRWPRWVSHSWLDFKPYGDREPDFDEPLFLRFAKQQLSLGDTPIALCKSSVPYDEESDPQAPVAPPKFLDALLARIAEIDALNVGQPPAKLSENTSPGHPKSGTFSLWPRRGELPSR